MQLQLPLASDVVEQIGVPPSNTVTVVPDSPPVPLIAGVESFVLLPDAGLMIVGAFGAVVSTVTITGVDDGLVSPRPVAVAVIEWLPSVRGVVGVQLHVPFVLTVVVQIGVFPSSTVTVVPTSAVPLKVGVVVFVLLPEAGLVSIGMFGVVGTVVAVSV